MNASRLRYRMVNPKIETAAAKASRRRGEFRLLPGVLVNKLKVTK